MSLGDSHDPAVFPAPRRVGSRTRRSVFRAKNAAHAATLIVLLAGAELAAERRPPCQERVDRRVAKFFGGADNALHVRQASRVEAIAIGPGFFSPTGPKEPGSPIAFAYLRATPQLLGDADARLLGQLLTRARSFDFPPPNGGIVRLCGGFQPGVALRFWKDGVEAPVVVLICFNCEEAGVLGRVAPALDADGEERAIEVRRRFPTNYFRDAPNPELHRSLGRIVPADPKNAPLPEKRRTAPPISEATNAE